MYVATWAALRGMEDEEVAPLKDVLRMGHCHNPSRALGWNRVPWLY